MATPNKNLHIWICLFQLCKVCFASWGGGNHYYDSTTQTAMQQHVVEHREHDKAQQKLWSSTACGLSSRCPDTDNLPLDLARSGRESEVGSAHLSLTIIQFTAHVIVISNTHSQQAHICKSYESPVAMSEQRSSRWETLEAVVADLHTGGLVLYGRFPEERSSMGNSAAELIDWAALLGSHYSPRSMGKGLEKVPKTIACFKTPGWLTAISVNRI